MTGGRMKNLSIPLVGAARNDDAAKRAGMAAVKYKYALEVIRKFLPNISEDSAIALLEKYLDNPDFDDVTLAGLPVQVDNSNDFLSSIKAAVAEAKDAAEEAGVTKIVEPGEIIKILNKMRNALELSPHEAYLIANARNIDNIRGILQYKDGVSQYENYENALILFLLSPDNVGHGKENVLQNQKLFNDALQDMKMLRGEIGNGQKGLTSTGVMRRCRIITNDIAKGNPEVSDELKSFLFEVTSQKVQREVALEKGADVSIFGVIHSDGSYLQTMRRNAIAFYGLPSQMEKAVAKKLEETWYRAFTKRRRFVKRINRAEIELKENILYTSVNGKDFLKGLVEVATKGMGLHLYNRFKRKEEVGIIASLVARAFDKEKEKFAGEKISFVDILNLKKQALIKVRDRDYTALDSEDLSYSRGNKVKKQLINDMIIELDKSIEKGNACMTARKEATKRLLAQDSEKIKGLIRETFNSHKARKSYKISGKRIEELGATALIKIKDKRRKKIIEQTRKAKTEAENAVIKRLADDMERKLEQKGVLKTDEIKKRVKEFRKVSEKRHRLRKVLGILKKGRKSKTTDELRDEAIEKLGEQIGPNDDSIVTMRKVEDMRVKGHLKPRLPKKDAVLSERRQKAATSQPAPRFV
jgi:hypothetical protein